MRIVVILSALDDTECTDILRDLRTRTHAGELQYTLVSSEVHKRLRAIEGKPGCHPLTGRKLVVASRDTNWLNKCVQEFRDAGGTIFTADTASAVEARLSEVFGMTDILVFYDIPPTQTVDFVRRAKESRYSAILVAITGDPDEGSSSDDGIFYFSKDMSIDDLMEKLSTLRDQAYPY